jgi:hypothetical protein
MRRLAGAFFMLFFSTLSQATTVSTEYTDMWWVPEESGWGVNIAQQGDTLFVTIFVYDAQGNPIWYVAPATTFQGAAKFTGPLYTTTGPWFAGGPLDPSKVVTLQVGTVTFEPMSASKATLTYTVGGFVIEKVVTRQTWRTDSMVGLYLGAREGRWTGCDAALEGRVDSFSQIGISQDGNDVVIRDAGNRYTCVYTGKIGPAGRFSEIVGLGVCDDHVGRFLKASEVQVSQIGFSMRYTMETAGSQCNFVGYVGGMRQLP